MQGCVPVITGGVGDLGPQVVDLADINRPAPVFRFLDRFQIELIPGIGGDFFEVAIKVLHFDQPLVLVERNDAEFLAFVQVLVPVSQDGIGFGRHGCVLGCRCRIRRFSGRLYIVYLAQIAVAVSAPKRFGQGREWL